MPPKAKGIGVPPVAKRKAYNFRRFCLVMMSATVLIRAALLGLGLLSHSKAATIFSNTSSPLVTVKNGTYMREYNT